MFIMISLSRERMIEIMNSFVWEWGEKSKECVFIMISLSLSWERRMEIMNSFLWELGG